MAAPQEKPGLVARLITYMLTEKPDLFFAILRNIQPILVTPKAVFITRFLDVQEALSRPEIFQVTYAPMMNPSVGPFMLARDNTVYNQRDKGIMRAMMQREDLPTIREQVSQLTRSAIDGQRDNKCIEVVSQISRMVPVLLTGSYFGFPGPDTASMFRWSRATQYDMFHNVEGNAKVHHDNIDAGQEMKAYLEQLLPQRRAEIAAGATPDDILSRIMRSSFVDSIHFDDARIITNTMGTLVGGIETTSQAIVQILDQLFKRPEELQQAIAAAQANDDEAMYQYCWEALRFNPINPFVVRRCVKDYRIASGTWRSKVVPAGTTVLVSTRSAMRDGRELDVASTFCTDRPAYHYMHLGYGLHTCLGDQLSRVQVPEIVKHLLKLPNLRPTGTIDFEGGPFPEKYTVEFG